MTFKQLFLSFCLIFSGALSSSVFCQATKPAQVVTLSYKKVIATRQWLNIVTKIVSTLFHEVPMRDVPGALKILAKGKSTPIKDLVAQYPNFAPYEKTMYDLATMGTFNHDVIQVLQKLKDKGVTLVLTSNMRAELVDYLKKSNPEVLGLFDLVFSGNEQNGKKPTEKYYSGLRAAINKRVPLTNQSTLVCVDSDKNSIDALHAINFFAKATDAPMKPLLFTNAQDLENQFVKLGFL